MILWNCLTDDIKVYVAADGNYTEAESTNTMTLTINKSTTSLAINTMNGKTYDGTAVTNPAAADMSITGAAYTNVKFAYSKHSDMSSPLATAPKDAGTYYVQAGVTEGDNINAANSTAVSFTIAQASATGVSQEYPVFKTLAKEYSFDLSKLLPSIASTQEYGNVTYAVGTVGNTDSVLTAVPTNSDIANGKLTLKVASVADKDKTATVEIQITTDNFTVTNAVITVKTVDKTPLTISGVAMSERVYNGSAHAYTGTPTFTNTTDNNAVTGVSFTKEYEGRAGTVYTKSETAPTNAGKYNLILTVSGISADTYDGTLTVPFAITQKEVTIKAKDKDILAGEEIPSLANPVLDTDYTVAGFIGTDTLTGTVSMSYTGTPDNTKHGSYPINISSGTVSDNYTVKYETGTLTISIEVSLITAAITAADNAKGGIATYDTAAVVPTGTKFVTTAEMSTLNTAIQTATDAKATCTTLAQVQAAAKALDDAVANFKAAIKTGTYTAPSGGDGDGSGSSSGGGSNAANDTKTDTSTTGKTEVKVDVDQNGNATVSVTDKAVADTIKQAQDTAKKNGTEKNGISVVVNVTTNMDTGTISANLPKSVQEKLITANVKEFKLVSKNVEISLNQAAIAQVKTTANTDVSIIAAKADSTKLSKEVQDALNGRPVYDLKATYVTTVNGKQQTNAISQFGSGSVSIAIPYTLRANEKPGNLCAIYIDDNGKVTYINNSSYDVKTGKMIFRTNHFSYYGIGYKEDTKETKFTDIANHWAKNDIEFVATRGLLAGTAANTFSPNTSMTRGMFVTALGRLAGADVSSYKKSSFTDVKANDYYMGYVEWANSKGIIKGTSTTTFAPDQAVTREEMAVMMANYAKAMGYTMPSSNQEIAFADSSNISTWAKEAVKSMQMAGIISGKDNNHFDPKGTATTQGWTKNDSGHWLYYKDGKTLTGWQTVDGLRYYFNSDGVMHEGWKQSADGKWYYLKEDGAMAVSTTIDRYEVDDKGVRKTK